jgi:nicotinamide riboside kinase
MSDAAPTPGHGPVIAVLGAESTGKTTLAAALAEALVAQGRPATVVTEYLREFCDAEGRTPRADEQRGIAEEQWRRINEAAASGRVVLADTTMLMTAVYSEFVFGDRSLYEAALARQQACALNLLTGLDLPWRPDGLQRDGAQVRAPVDALIRAALGSAGLPFAVVYGQGEARMAQALAAVRQRLGMPRPPAEGDGTDAGSTLRLRCRECMQPECEHRLFAALTRATADPA